MTLSTERQIAIAAVREACHLTRIVQSRLVAGATLAKKDRSPVTVADFGAQALVSHRLAVALDDPLVGEEDAAALRADPAMAEKVVSSVQARESSLSAAAVLDAIDRGTHAGGPSGRFWTLDPIDGTRGFLRMAQYAVALALIEDGQVQLGVLGCPALDWNGQKGCIFAAVRGQGAFVRGIDDDAETPVHVTDITEAAQARFCESVEKAHSKHSDSARIAELLGITQPPYRIDSQCKYAAVALGDASIYLRLPTRKDYVERIWDHAAGVAVVTEAGGRVTDIRGNALDFSQGRGLERNKGVITTNGHLHDATLSAVGRVLDF